ncbi:hypothetical protein HY404_02290 [Candidatus Microgenomates bacterium]|nr:hypothetical protein [Candidatus Microgenomates bacterium]
MRVSKRKVNRILENELTSMLYQLLADLKTKQEVEIVLKDFLGETEVKTFAKRMGIAYWLSKGRSVANIRDNLAVSSATIETVKNQMKKSAGFDLALKKISADEWATVWSEKIKKFVK